MKFSIKGLSAKQVDFDIGGVILMALLMVSKITFEYWIFAIIARYKINSRKALLML